MKKIIFSFIALISLIAVGVMAFGLISAPGPGRAIPRPRTDNTLTAGTLDLLINSQMMPFKPAWSSANLSPGVWDLTGQAVLKNDGTITGISL